MSSSAVQAAERAPAGAVCAVHPAVEAYAVCARCGNYACLVCTKSTADAFMCTRCFDGVKIVAHLGEASGTQRFLNLIIDNFIGSQLLSFLAGIILALTGVFEFVDGFFLVRFLYGILILVTYYVICEGSTGRSLGKLITGTKVVSADGGKPTLKQVVLRSLIRFIPFEAFSFLGDNGGWHDKWTGTKVVRVRGAKQWDATGESLAR